MKSTCLEKSMSKIITQYINEKVLGRVEIGRRAMVYKQSDKICLFVHFCYVRALHISTVSLLLR
jgi:hypothetical protein